MDAVLAAGVGLLFVLTVAVLLFVRLIHREVKTLRGQMTTGQIVGEGESRRIEGLAEDERTQREQRHLDHEAVKEAPDDRGQ